MLVSSLPLLILHYHNKFILKDIAWDCLLVLLLLLASALANNVSVDTPGCILVIHERASLWAGVAELYTKYRTEYKANDCDFGDVLPGRVVYD